MHLRGVSGGGERKGWRQYFRAMTKNFQNVWKISNYGFRARGTPRGTNKKESSWRHSRLKLNRVKDKEKKINAARGIREVTGKSHGETGNGLLDGDTGNWNEMSETTTKPAKIPVNDDGKVKTFSDGQTLREFTSFRGQKTVPKEILTDGLQEEGSRSHIEGWRCRKEPIVKKTVNIQVD